MKTIGIIGGIGPESTVEYYRLIIASYRERTQDGSYPPILINSIDLQKVLQLVGANELAKVAEYLVREVERLARAGQRPTRCRRGSGRNAGPFPAACYGRRTARPTISPRRSASSAAAASDRG